MAALSIPMARSNYNKAAWRRKQITHANAALREMLGIDPPTRPAPAYVLAFFNHSGDVKQLVGLGFANSYTVVNGSMWFDIEHVLDQSGLPKGIWPRLSNLYIAYVDEQHRLDLTAHNAAHDAVMSLQTTLGMAAEQAGTNAGAWPRANTVLVAIDFEYDGNRRKWRVGECPCREQDDKCPKHCVEVGIATVNLAALGPDPKTWTSPHNITVHHFKNTQLLGWRGHFGDVGQPAPLHRDLGRTTFGRWFEIRSWILSKLGNNPGVLPPPPPAPIRW